MRLVKWLLILAYAAVAILACIFAFDYRPGSFEFCFMIMGAVICASHIGLLLAVA